MSKLPSKLESVGSAVKKMLDSLPALPDHASDAVPKDDYPTVVLVTDEVGPGGAHHQYAIAPCDADGNPKRDAQLYGSIKFQKGGRVANGVNGCTEMDLLGIVAHRLAAFQNGPFPSEDNEHALQALDSVMFWLNRRTENRISRGVEGTEQA
jgi:hypothetical protein